MSLSNPTATNPSYSQHQHPHAAYSHLPHNTSSVAAAAAVAAVAAAVMSNANSNSNSNPAQTNPAKDPKPAAEKSPLSVHPTNTNAHSAYETAASHSAPVANPHQNLKTNTNPNIKVKLQDMSLWKQFNAIGTEMIITKCGRRMFPSLRVSISGLEASSKYLMVIDIIPVDDNRYKYHNCEWIVSGKAEAHFAGRGYLHPDSPLSGSQWMKQIISFHKLKLTNNPFDRAGHIILNSMHKYVPRLHIIEEGKSISTFIFTDAIFTAVTAYQNELITKLKIEYNPFAKGFRDGQSRKDYRNGKRGSDDENEFGDENIFSNNTGSSSQMMSHGNSAKFIKTEREPSMPMALAPKDLNAKYNSMQHAYNQQQQSQQHNFGQTNNYSNLGLPNKLSESASESNSLLYDF